MSDRAYSSSGSGVSGLIPAQQWTHDTTEERSTRSHGHRAADAAARSRRRQASEARSSRADASAFIPHDSARYAARAASSSSHSRIASARFGDVDVDAHADAERDAAAWAGAHGSVDHDQLAALRARAEAIVDAEEEERRREYEQRETARHRSSSRTSSHSSSRRSNRPASAAPSRATTSGSHSRATMLAPLDHQPRLSPRPQSASASAARPTTLSWVDEEPVYLIHNPNLRRATGQQLDQLEASPSREHKQEQSQQSRSSSRHGRRESSRSRARSRSRSASPKHHHRSRCHRSAHSHSRRREHSRSRSRARSRSRSRSRSPPRSPTRSILSVHVGDDKEDERIEVFSPHSAREYRIASRPSTAQQSRPNQQQQHLYSASPHDFGPYADPLGRTRSNDQRIVALEKQEEAAWKAERDAATAAASASAALTSPARRSSKFASLARRVSHLATAFSAPVDINYELDTSELDAMFPEDEHEKQEREARERSKTLQQQQEATPAVPENPEPDTAADAQVAPSPDQSASSVPVEPTPSRDRMHLSHARSHSLQVAELDTPAGQRHVPPPQRQHSNADSVDTEIYEPVSSSPTPQPNQQQSQPPQQPPQPQSHRIRLVSDDAASSGHPPSTSPSTAASGYSPFVDLRLPRGLSASEMLAAVQQALASPFASEDEAALFREWAKEKAQRKLVAEQQQQQQQQSSSPHSVPPLPRSQTLDSSDVIPAYQFFSLDAQQQHPSSQPQHQHQQQQSRDFDREMEEKYATPRGEYEQQQQQQQPQRTSSVEFAAPSSSPEPLDSARSSLSSPNRGGLRPSRVQTVRELRQSINLQQLQLQHLMGAEPEASSSGAAAVTETPPPSHHAHTASIRIPETPDVHHGRHYSIEPSTPARSVSSVGGATVTSSSAPRAQQEPTQAAAPPTATAAPASVSSPHVPVAAPVASAVESKAPLDPLSFDYDFDLPSPSLSWPNSPIANSRRASMHDSDDKQKGGRDQVESRDDATEEHKDHPALVSPHSPPALMQIPPQPSVDQYVEHFHKQYAQWMAQQQARSQQQQQQQQEQAPEEEQEREKQPPSPARRTEPHSHHPPQPPPQSQAYPPASSHADLRNNPQYRAVYAQYLQHFARLQMQRAGLVGRPPPPAYAAALNAHYAMPLHAQMQWQQQQQQAIDAARLVEEHQRSKHKRALRDERHRQQLQKDAQRAAAKAEDESLRRRQHALAVQLREEEELRMLRDDRRRLDGELAQSGRRGLLVHAVRPASSTQVPRSHPIPSSSSRHVPDASFSELIASATAAGAASSNGVSAHGGRTLRPAAPTTSKDNYQPHHDHVNPTLILATGFSPPRHSAQGDRKRDAAKMPRPPAAARPASAASAVAAASAAIELAAEAASRSRATIAAATAAAAAAARLRNSTLGRGAAVHPRVSAVDSAASQRRIVDQQRIKTLPSNGHGFRPSKAAAADAAPLRPQRPSQPAPRAPLHRQHSFSSRASLHTSEEEEWSTSSDSGDDDDDDDESTVVGGQSSAAASSVAANRRGEAQAAASTTATSTSKSTVAPSGSPAMQARRFDIRVHAPEEHAHQT